MGDSKQKLYRLSDLQLDEVSLVDIPANQFSDVVLVKRADGTVEKGTKGIKFVLGITDDGASEVQSVIFDSKDWEVQEAKSWLEEHDFKSGKVDETENKLRFRQMDPGKFKRFRTVSPGARTSKAIRTSGMSFEKIRGLVETKLRETYQKGYGDTSKEQRWDDYIFIRELYKDTVIFEQAGKCYGVEFELDGEAVKLSDKVDVEIVYREKAAKTADAITAGVITRTQIAEGALVVQAVVPEAAAPETSTLQKQLNEIFDRALAVAHRANQL